MRKSLVFRTCALLYSLLLLSPRATCLSLHKLEKRDVPDENKDGVGMDNSQSFSSSLLHTTQSTTVKDANNSVVLPNVELDVLDDSQINLTSDQNVEDHHLENEADATAENKTSIEDGIQTVNYTTTLTNLTREDPKEPDQLLAVNSSNLDHASVENASQVNTMEMLTTNPRTNIVKTEDAELTTSSQPIGGPSTSGNLFIPESPMDPENSTLIHENSVVADGILSQFNEDWDDTKLPTLGPNTVRSEDVVTLIPDLVSGNDSSEAAVFTVLPGVTVPSDDKSVFSAGANLPEEEGSFELNKSGMIDIVSPLPLSLSDDKLFTPLPNGTEDGVQSQDLSATLTADARQPDSDVNDNSNVTMAPSTFTVVTSQETFRGAEVIDEAGEAVMDRAPPQGDIPADETVTGPPSPPQVLPADIPSTEDMKLHSEDEDPLSSSLSPVLPEATEGADSTSVVFTSAPEVGVIVPPAWRITSATPFGLERVESEEGDDEDEEEEDEDDDEGEDDEEEEDEKENESVDDSAEKDSDMPLFTLPGLSSQEPLEDESNIALIDGAAYQVPDTLEWEQQNQGLVRSWMEKLKDKAGYMSGMLVPVGVGIAGAILILGALYSIKIMNRRRRNGFKRHKRKTKRLSVQGTPLQQQREFNSMQDRVMLLADSSEDEF